MWCAVEMRKQRRRKNNTQNGAQYSLRVDEAEAEVLLHRSFIYSFVHSVNIPCKSRVISSAALKIQPLFF